MPELPASRTILIIDDNPHNLGVIAEYLETFGCRVLVARDGEGGIARATYARPDLILLDVMMPGLDGFETCRRLKQNAETRDIPVIFMTALTSVEDKVRSFEIGAVDYVTKPIQHEEVLARITTHLRLSELTEQLQHTNQELTRINADKDKLFSIIAHDLRGLFLPLLGNAELLGTIADEITSDEIREISAGIHHSGRLALDLLEHLLEWARVRMGHLQHQPASLNLHAVVEETIALLLHQADDQAIRLDNQVPNRLQVFADRYMLATALRNLIINALKFTPAQGQIVVNARPGTAAAGAAEPAVILVSVSDTGIGMSEAQCAQIFEPLGHHQSRPGLRAERGSGLGLVICKEVIARNGGEISVVSQQGQGTTFTFSVPCDHQASAPAPAGAMNTAPTVLVVDPDVANRNGSITMLESLGYQVLAADGSTGALQLAARHQGTLDLLIIEVILPGQNGALLAARLVETYPQMHILFTSDNHPRIIQLLEQQQQQSTGIAYLQRPYDAVALQTTIAALRQRPSDSHQPDGPLVAPDSMA